DTFSSAVDALEKHFTPKVNIVVERHAFRKRTQSPHETVEQYVTALRDLASKCDFDDKTEEMIRDQLVEHIFNSRIRERLLLEPDLTLDKAVTLAAQMESAAYQAKALTANSDGHVQAIQSRSYSATKNNNSVLRPTKAPSATSTSAKSCFRHQKPYSVTLKLTVDTGSAVSILPQQTYKEHFSGTPLRPPDLRLVTYTKKTIPVLGCLQVEGTPLLGQNLMEALHICITGNAVLPPCTAPAAPVMTTDASPASLASAAAADIGCVKSFVHKVRLDPTVKPVRQKLRRLPFAVRAPVSAELNRLLKAGVIERIDASPWVSPIVVTGRKTGEVG
uniref:Retrotransposon gag domain-containing protein n=1 Tax=Poecilia formosa TaxID=48698 RepID=A0A096M9H1_POEFO